MTGFLTSLFSVGSHSGAGTDRKNTLSGYGDLSNLFNYGMNQGKNATSESSDLLGQAGGYFSKLLSGDRSATLSAVAPTVNAADTMTDAAKRNLSSSGTARGGGINSTTQTLEDSKRASIDSAINNARGDAAKGATSVGGTVAAQAANLLGLGDRAATSLTDASIEGRKGSNAIHEQNAKQWADVTQGALDILFGG